MISKEIDCEFASPEEVARALESLSKADLIRIGQIARMRVAGLTTMDWEDLVNESVSRALGGARKWPRNVPFLAFFIQTMRSIANEERRLLKKKQSIKKADQQTADSTEITVTNDVVDRTDPERTSIVDEAIENIESLFSKDTQAMAVIHGHAEGLTPAEIQLLYSMTSTQYSSTQKRIRRRLVSHFMITEN
jgi:DNA-directed RNA polymerase specialized sigma24 family protein